MADRTSITPVQMPIGYSLTGTQLTMTAADVANGNQAIASGNDIIIVYNSGIAAHNITVTASNDPYSRSTNKTKSIGAGQVWISGVLPKVGWMQPGGALYFSGDHASLLIAVVAL